MRKRRTSGIISVGVGLTLALATLMFGAGPAAAAQDTTAGARAATSTSEFECPIRDYEDDDYRLGGKESPKAIEDVRDLVLQLELDGKVTCGGAVRLLLRLNMAEQDYERIGCVYGVEWDRVLISLEGFKEYASNPRLVPGEDTQQLLVATADQLYEDLCAPK